MVELVQQTASFHLIQPPKTARVGKKSIAGRIVASRCASPISSDVSHRNKSCRRHDQRCHPIPLAGALEFPFRRLFGIIIKATSPRSSGQTSLCHDAPAVAQASCDPPHGDKKQLQRSCSSIIERDASNSFDQLISCFKQASFCVRIPIHVPITDARKLQP